ncbi:MAG: hypothetical protein GY849_21080 [Deltaproteobacteria bacterium]|nr:hypothetical protein [Deltaproteobacteria bacterium]
MIEVQLQYLGKKNPCRIDTPMLSAPVACGPDKPIWVPEHDARWLMETNPKMFRKLSEKGTGDDEEPMEDAADIIKKKEEQDAADGVPDQADPFESLTKARIAELALEKYDVEIRVNGKNKAKVIEEYKDAEKTFLGG